MEYARQPGDGFFEVGTFTQRVVEVAGSHHEESDELFYVLEGTATLDLGGAKHPVGTGCAFLAPAGAEWSATGDARALSVLVHDADPTGSHAVLDLGAVEKGTATAGRQFVL